MAYALRTKYDALDAYPAADQNQSVDNDVFFNTVVHDGNDWATWAAAPTGFNGALTTEYYYYKLIGDLVVIKMRFGGTSNAVTKTAVGPFTAYGVAADGAFDCPALIQDNTGAFVWGRAAMQGGTTTINFYTTPNAGAWTNAGTAFVQVNTFYRVA